MKFCVLYNPKSGGKGRGKDPAKKLLEIMPDDELYYRSMPEIADFQTFFNEVHDPIIACGGDGTLSYFLNKIHGLKYQNSIWYYPTGSGNDFNADLGESGEKPYCIDKYIRDLPILKADGKERVVFNGSGAGIDGYVCSEGERLRKAGKKTINYTLIGIKGLLYDFKTRNITIDIDGLKQKFENVWFSPIMLGKYFGGGMMVAPMRDRLKKDLTVIVATSKNRIKVTSIFPKIFKGQHIKYEKIVKVLHGKHIKITLDRPAPLQYDGEVIPNVSEYEMWI